MQILKQFHSNGLELHRLFEFWMQIWLENSWFETPKGAILRIKTNL